MEIKTTSKFRKDLKQAKKKRLNLTLLQDVIDKLAAKKWKKNNTRMPYSTKLVADIQDIWECTHSDTCPNWHA